MSDKIAINDLLDFYNCLLTTKQQEICRLYYQEDCSLAEIGQIEGITRNAVYDTIKRSEELLNGYESKLKLRSSYNKRIHLYNKIKEKTSDPDIIKLVDKCIDTELEEENNE